MNVLKNVLWAAVFASAVTVMTVPQAAFAGNKKSPPAKCDAKGKACKSGKNCKPENCKKPDPKKK